MGHKKKRSTEPSEGRGKINKYANRGKGAKEIARQETRGNQGRQYSPSKDNKSTRKNPDRIETPRGYFIEVMGNYEGSGKTVYSVTQSKESGGKQIELLYMPENELKLDDSQSRFKLTVQGKEIPSDSLPNVSSLEGLIQSSQKRHVSQMIGDVLNYVRQST